MEDVRPEVQVFSRQTARAEFRRQMRLRARTEFRGLGTTRRFRRANAHAWARIAFRSWRDRMKQAYENFRFMNVLGGSNA